ncbi:MAG: hypothetical protein WCX88_02145 [Patescibacteria group bacterium]
MLNTSLDVLYLTIAACILWVTILCSFLFYYAIIVAKRAKDIADMIADKIEKIGQVIDLVKSKLEPTVSQIFTLIQGAKKVADFFKNRAAKKKSAKKD